MITNAVIQQPAVVNAALRHNANMDEEEKKKCESHSVPNDTIPDKTTTTTEKGIATAMIPAGRHCNDSRNSSDGDSFESLFNGSTYYIDEYFNSIGFDGGSSMSSGTGSSYGGQQHHLHHHTIPMECRSIISGISGDDGDDVYYDSQSDHHRNHHPNSHMSNTNSDVASVDTSPSLSSSASSTLNGLIISNDASSSSSSTSSLSMSAAVLSPHHHKSAVNAVVTNVDASLTPVTKPKLPETTKSSSFRVKMLLLLEKIIVTSLLLAIAASCTITILAIVRHLHYDPNTNPGTAAPGIVTSYNHTTTTTTSSGNSTASGDERWSHIRNIVRDRYGESAFDPIPGTPQHDALVWMTYVDVPSILGHDLQPRNIASDTNDTNETEAALVWNTNLSIRITQRYVLLVLFFHNIGTEHLMLGGWASLTGARLTECIWPGITCRRKVATATEPNTQLSVVTGLELNPWIAHVHGSIPTEIGFLPHLESLVFTDNFLSGSLPSELYTLQKLHTLRISNTSISSALSPDIGNLTDMAFLDLSNNIMSAAIPTELGWLTNLQYLNLAQNNFTGTIPTELGNFQVLKNLFLEDNAFHGTMPPAICSLPSLHRLEELHADCWLPPLYEQRSCDPPKSRIFCDCCTYCF